MDKKMFCFQCEQTVGCTGCTGNAGVCGKKADTARLQDELTGALIGLARAVDDTAAISKRTGQIIIEGLFTTVTNVSFDDAAIENMIQKVRAEKERLVPDCSKCQSSCGKTDEYDMQQLWNADEDIRSLKSLILFGIRGMAAYAYHAMVLGYRDESVERFLSKALFAVGEDWSMEELLPLVLELGEVNLRCMALLVGMPRLFMLVQVAPFMGGNILTGQLRTTVVFACYLVLHPAIVASLPETQGLSPSTFALYGAILVKETLIGMLLGYLSGMLFWTIQCAGFFIDNQRGASMAEGADPLSGEQTSPLGSFFFQSAVYLFFSTGAFLALLGVVYASYEIWPVTQLIPLSVFKDINLPLFFAGRVSWLLLMMLLLSGPIVVACLLTDVSLGLINRFASQLNVYVLAMPIKSGVAAFLMLFYFMMLLSNATGLFDGVKADFEQLRRLLP